MKKKRTVLETSALGLLKGERNLMKKILQKLSSRKLWAAAAGIVTGLALVFGLDEGVIATVAGAVVSVASVVTYIVTEGRVDAQSVKTVVQAVQNAEDALRETDGK